MQTFVHYFLHFIFPFFMAIIFFKKDWKKVYVILIATMIVDLDHLWAEPIFQANRCSIGFHYLHTYYAMIAYVFLLFWKGTFRVIGIGLLFHMLTDLIDCLFMFHQCKSCLSSTPVFTLLEFIYSFLSI